jgi:tRNA G18 (ribose-2'-O)-methylase SpoU
MGQRQYPEDPAALLERLPPRASVLVLSGISNHDNIGGIFRNAAAFEAAAVLLDPQCCDPLYRKAIRVSVGAVLKVPFCRIASTQEALSLLSRNGFDSWSLSPAGKRTIGECRFGPRTAFILGTEGEGLPQDILDTTNSLRIPISQGFDSLNVSAASAIALHRYFDSQPAL